MIDPDEGAYHLSSRPTTVLFPLPLAPTNAVVLPAGIEMLKSRSTGAPGREGYAKARFVISILPSQPSLGIFPDSSSGSSSDFLSMMLKSSDAAAVVYLQVSILWQGEAREPRDHVLRQFASSVFSCKGKHGSVKAMFRGSEPRDNISRLPSPNKETVGWRSTDLLHS